MENEKGAPADAETRRVSIDLVSTVVRSAKAWLDSHADLLREVDAMTHAWHERRRETIKAVWQSLEAMRDSQRPTDLLRIQQEWSIGSLRRVASDVEAWVMLAGAIWQRTTLSFTEASQRTVAGVRRASDAVVSGSNEAPMLSAAGSKPRGRPRGTPQRKPKEADTVDWASTVR